MIDDNVILDHVYFIGLYLAVIDRRDLSLVEHAFYNTSTFKVNASAASEDTRFEFSHDGFTTIDDFGIANDMATRIRAYDYNYFIVVASQYQWEQQFSKELGETLMHCGALNIMEMTNHYSPRFGNSTKFLNVYDVTQIRQPRNNLYHPYAFVGIPGLSPGMGFEKLRSNQGYYLTTGDYPYAELVVRLRYNSLTSMYAFDQEQYHPHFHFDDSYQTVFQNYDMSLRTQIGQILTADLPAYYNFRQNIYMEALDEVF